MWSSSFPNILNLFALFDNLYHRNTLNNSLETLLPQLSRMFLIVGKHFSLWVEDWHPHWLHRFWQLLPIYFNKFSKIYEFWECTRPFGCSSLTILVQPWWWTWLESFCCGFNDCISTGEKNAITSNYFPGVSVKTWKKQTIPTVLDHASPFG